MRFERDFFNEFERIDDRDVILLALGEVVRHSITVITLLLVPALSFADCNMTSTCPGNPNPQYSADAHGQTLDAANMFSQLGAALMNGVGSAAPNSGEGTVVQNSQKSQSLTGLDSKGRKILPGAKDEANDGSDIIQ